MFVVKNSGKQKSDSFKKKVFKMKNTDSYQNTDQNVLNFQITFLYKKYYFLITFGFDVSPHTHEFQTFNI